MKATRQATRDFYPIDLSIWSFDKSSEGQAGLRLSREPYAKKRTAWFVRLSILWPRWLTVVFSNSVKIVPSIKQKMPQKAASFALWPRRDDSHAQGQPTKPLEIPPVKLRMLCKKKGQRFAKHCPSWWPQEERIQTILWMICRKSMR